VVNLGQTVGNGDTMSLVQDKGGVLLVQLKAAPGVTSGTLLQIVDGNGVVKGGFDASGLQSPSGQRQPVISGQAATRTLLAAESGSLCYFDLASGITYTLPTAPAAGTWFDFAVLTTVTTNSYKVITGAGTELLVGTIYNVDTDSASAVAAWQSLAATSNIAVTQAAAGTNATGGIAGSWVRFTCLSATRWMVTGMILSGGTVATPFATS
jgi:hypothetical protein